VQLTLTSVLDRFNRVLACPDTFLARIVTEALDLVRFDPSLVAALEQDIDMAARVAKKAYDQRKTIRQVVEEEGILSTEELNRWLDPRSMIAPATFNKTKK
jgi:fumarate hydratase class II